MEGAFPFSFEWFLWVAIGVGYCGLLFRLWQTGLWRRYRAFVAYIVVNVLEQLSLLLVDAGSNVYGWVFLAFVPLRAVSVVLVVLELFSLVLKDYKGIGSLGRWVIWAGLAGSTLLALVSIYPDLSGPLGPYPLIAHAAVFERALSSALLFFLLLIAAFLVWFPVPLSRNTVIHTLLFAAFFSSHAILLLIRNVVSGVRVQILSTADLAVVLLCILIWTVALSRSGEALKVVFGHGWRRQGSQKLVRQLDSINATLLRVARK